MHPRKIPLLLLSLLLYLILFSSCSKEKILTDQETKWLQQNDTITIALFPYYPPYQFINDESDIVGIFIEYVGLIEKKIAYKFKRQYYLEWPQLMNDVRSGKIDIIMQIQATPDRASYLQFYAELFESQHVITTRKNTQNDKKINSFINKTITVPKDYAIFENLKRKYPALTFVEDKDDLTCLQKLNAGHYDAYIGPKAVVNYLIKSKNLDSLKIIADTEFTYKPGIAVVKKNEILNSIIQKGIAGITTSESQNITENWLYKETLPFYRKANFWIFFAVFIISLLFIILGINLYLGHLVNKKTKELRVAKTIAEKDNQLKSAFIHNVSHEIRTPMNGIIGFSTLLDDPELTNQEKKKYTKVIINSSKQLIDSVDNILEVSKLQTQQVILNPEETDLNNVLETIFSVFEIKAKQKGISLILNNNLSHDQSFIKIDNSRLIKIINSLLENSIKFTEKGAVLVSCMIQNSSLIISVRDSGIGLNVKDKEAVFKSFSQSENKISKKYGGLSLELTIAKENTILMGGKLSFSSIPNKGSTFRLELPYTSIISNKNVIRNALNTETDSAPNEYKVLIAEDGNVNFIFLKTILLKIKGYHFNIHRAENGKEAVDFCRKNTIDMVFMDIKMPKMNGYEATRVIKKMNPDLLIIAQTAYSTKEDIQNAFAAGCDDFISKPLDPKVLENKLLKHFPVSYSQKKNEI